jgi:Kinetochore Sim4 complex subunit FTA2
MDPFCAECRAYGRIEEQKCNGKVAVRCYGFTSIPATREKELSIKFNINTWDRPAEEYSMNITQRQPFRAIVKELVRKDSRFTDKVMNSIFFHLKRLRRMGVYPMDIRAPNYKDGLLVDFSVAWTEPHFMFQIRPKWMVEVLKRQDLLMFEKMKSETWVRAVRNEEYCSRLRSNN